MLTSDGLWSIAHWSSNFKHVHVYVTNDAPFIEHACAAWFGSTRAQLDADFCQPNSFGAPPSLSGQSDCRCPYTRVASAAVHGSTYVRPNTCATFGRVLRRCVHDVAYMSLRSDTFSQHVANVERNKTQQSRAKQ